jgi:hypothetical protein
MKEVKFFEIRDKGTNIPAFGVKLIPCDFTDDERYCFEHGGWGNMSEALYLTRICGADTQYSPFGKHWPDGSRTMQVAHEYIEANWDTLTSGQVVDVRVILGEASEPAKSDRFWGASAPQFEDMRLALLQVAAMEGGE